MATSDSPRLRTRFRTRDNPVFDHRTLRLVVGVIAFLMPWFATILAGRIPTSISGSYHTTDRARDVFVGTLAVIGVLLIAYRGHRPVLPPEKVGRFWKAAGSLLNGISRLWGGQIDFRVLGREREEDLVSTFGGIGAIVAALFPTACDTCATDLSSKLHYLGAILLFSNVVYFCLVAFLRSVASKLGIDDGVRNFLRQARRVPVPDRKKAVRGYIYVYCGWGVAAILLGLIVLQLFWPGPAKALRLTFWAEFAAMALFGVAWVTASLRPIRDANEPLHEEGATAAVANQPEASSS